MAEASSERQLFQLADVLGADWPNLAKAERATADALDRIKAATAELATPDTSLVLYGSLARRDFNSGSDVDWTFLVDGAADPQHLNAGHEIGHRIKELGFKQPGAEGIFGQLTFSHDLIHYIGGEDDTNQNLTRRMLLLLESVPVGSKIAYDRVVSNVLHRYLDEDHGWRYGRNPYGVPRFLQNDIARYWRTMAVDFAYKQRTRQGSGWALRVAKLRLSRKLIYAAGLLLCFSRARAATGPTTEPVAETDVLATIDELSSLSAQPPLDIVAQVILPHRELDDLARQLIGAYDDFLGLLDDPDKRNHLQELQLERAATDDLYEHVRGLSHTFQNGLDELFLGDNAARLADLTRTYGIF